MKTLSDDELERIALANRTDAQIRALYTIMDELLDDIYERVVRENDPALTAQTIDRLPSGFHRTELRVFYRKQLDAEKSGSDPSQDQERC